MDLNGQSNRRLSSLISRFQKNAGPEETKSSQKQEAKIEPGNRIAETSTNDDHPNTSDPLNCTSSSKAGPSPVIQSSYYPEPSMVETSNDLAHDWAETKTSPASEVKTTVAKETSPASKVKTTVAKETSPTSQVKTTIAKEISPASEAKTTVANRICPASEAKTTVANGICPASEVKTTVAKETSPASEIKTTIQPNSSETKRDTETMFKVSHDLPVAGTSDAEEHAPDTEEEAHKEDGGVDPAAENFIDYDDIADFNVDEFHEDSSDEELPTLQEIFQRCQMIRKRRFYQDLHNVWQKRIEREEKEEAVKILTACGFGKADPDEMGDGLDTALSSIPDRFWRQDSSAKDISIERLKMIVEEKKDVEERAQFRDYCEEAEGAQAGPSKLRRAAIATGGAKPSTLLYNYLKMNMLKSHVPIYYFPSYLRRFKSAMESDS